MWKAYAVNTVCHGKGKFLRTLLCFPFERGKEYDSLCYVMMIIICIISFRRTWLLKCPSLYHFSTGKGMWSNSSEIISLWWSASLLLLAIECLIRLGCVDSFLISFHNNSISPIKRKLYLASALRVTTMSETPLLVISLADVLLSLISRSSLPVCGQPPQDGCCFLGIYIEITWQVNYTQEDSI